MQEEILNGTTTSSTGQTRIFSFHKPKTNQTSQKKEIELPTFKTMPIVKAFEEIKDTINNQKNIFGDLITEGDLTILFGRSNIGKSFISYQIGEAVAQGKNVLDVIDEHEIIKHGENKFYNLNNETAAQKVLYVDFEGTIEKDYLRYSSKDFTNPDKPLTPYQFSGNFITAFPERLSVSDNLSFIDAIELEVMKTGAKVVIIDNLSAVSQDSEKSGNATKLMNKIKDMQRRNKLSVLLMAHTPKIHQGEPIIANNLAGSSNLYNLADSVIAINISTMSEDIRYIKQLKSRYNEIQFHQDNVVAIQFTTRPDGFKGFRFLNYESEQELIKPEDKSMKDEEDHEIINLVVYFGMSAAKIAEELHSKFAPDVDIRTYKERIKKRIQRLKAKGKIVSNEANNAIENTPITIVSNTPSSTISTNKKTYTNNIRSTTYLNDTQSNEEHLDLHTKKENETSAEFSRRICNAIGIRTSEAIEEEERELAWLEIQKELEELKSR